MLDAVRARCSSTSRGRRQALSTLAARLVPPHVGALAAGRLQEIVRTCRSGASRRPSSSATTRRRRSARSPRSGRRCGGRPTRRSPSASSPTRALLRRAGADAAGEAQAADRGRPPGDGRAIRRAILRSLTQLLTPLHPPLQCALAPGGPPYRLATFVPEKKGAPATVRLWQCADFGEGRFLATKTFYKACGCVRGWWRCAFGRASSHHAPRTHHHRVQVLAHTTTSAWLTARSSVRSAGRRTAARSSSTPTPRSTRRGKSRTRRSLPAHLPLL